MCTIIGMLAGMAISIFGHLAPETAMQSAAIGALGLIGVWLEKIADQLQKQNNR